MINIIPMKFPARNFEDKENIFPNLRGKAEETA